MAIASSIVLASFLSVPVGNAQNPLEKNIIDHAYELCKKENEAMGAMDVNWDEFFKCYYEKRDSALKSLEQITSVREHEETTISDCKFMGSEVNNRGDLWITGQAPLSYSGLLIDYYFKVPNNPSIVRASTFVGPGGIFSDLALVASKLTKDEAKDVMLTGCKKV